MHGGHALTHPTVAPRQRNEQAARNNQGMRMLDTALDMHVGDPADNRVKLCVRARPLLSIPDGAGNTEAPQPSLFRFRKWVPSLFSTGRTRASASLLCLKFAR